MTEDRKPETPGGVGVAAVAPPSSASMSDDPLIVLGEQWKEAYDNWLEADPTGDSDAEIKAQEERKAELGKIAWAIEDRAADLPAQSLAGALAQLRMAGTHYRLMEYYDGKWTGDKYAQITWQAWDGLERLIGTAAAEDPVLALKREWETRWQRYESEADSPDAIMRPLHDALSKTAYEIFQTPATTLAGIAFKLVLWARQHVEGGYEGNTGWSRPPVTAYSRDLDHLPVVSALHDLERMARATTGADTPPAEDD